jgi:hypothetical protein
VRQLGAPLRGAAEFQGPEPRDAFAWAAGGRAGGGRAGGQGQSRPAFAAPFGGDASSSTWTPPLSPEVHAPVLCSHAVMFYEQAACFIRSVQTVGSQCPIGLAAFCLLVSGSYLAVSWSSRDLVQQVSLTGPGAAAYQRAMPRRPRPRRRPPSTTWAWTTSTTRAQSTRRMWSGCGAPLATAARPPRALQPRRRQPVHHPMHSAAPLPRQCSSATDCAL